MKTKIICPISIQTIFSKNPNNLKNQHLSQHQTIFFQHEVLFEKLTYFYQEARTHL